MAPSIRHLPQIADEVLSKVPFEDRYYEDLNFPQILKAILSSTIWHDYERGRLSEDECYRLSGDRFSLDPQEVRRAILDARDSLRPDESFISFIRDLRSGAQNTLRIFAMSNISAPDYAVTRARPEEWGIFERIFTSAAAGMRKPELCFFKFVLDQIKAEPSSVVFVDDRSENVLAARSLGMNGIVFDDVQRVRQSLRIYTGDPIVSSSARGNPKEASRVRC
ncbi:phosphatase yihX [Lactarius hengduanensis]|nr:phosphatase yihX [Lactarius hengduanensis]